MKETLQEPWTTTRRTQILEAAAGVFAGKGFHAATVRDVARAAGVADGTIYNHFENKGALLLGLFEEMTRRAHQEIDPKALIDLDLREFFRAYFSHPLRAFQDGNFELFRVILSEVMVNRELGERFWAQVLGPTIQGGEDFARRWADHHGVVLPHGGLTLRVASGLVLGLLVQRALGDETLAATWDELPDLLAELLLKDLAPDER